MKKIKILILTTLALFALLLVRPALAEFIKDTDDTFTIVWLSDTQDMAYHGYNNAMHKMGEWIISQKDTLDIRYVVQSGDMVDNGAAIKQWGRFDAMYNAFKEEIPYISTAGNHEIKKNGYLEYSMRPEVLAIPESNRYLAAQALFQTFESNGTKFIILGIGYEPEASTIPWVNGVLSAHPEHVAILLIHDYLQNGGKYRINGKEMFEQVVLPNPNVRMVLCGHVKGVSSRFDDIDDDGDGTPDRVVAQLMYNYQHFEDKCGQLRIMQFNTVDRSITITTYSPVTDRFYRDYMFGDKSTFIIENAF